MRHGFAFGAVGDLVGDQTRARRWSSTTTGLVRSCVGRLFEASSSSQTLLSADIQRCFRDIHVLHQHANLQPNTGEEIYGRVLAGLGPNSPVV